MELKLNIYKGREVEKTYVADEYDIMFGTVEDLISIIDLDAFSNEEANDADFLKACMNIVRNGFEQVKSLLKDVFPDVTDDELKRTKIKEVASLLLNLTKFSFVQINSVNKNEKN